MDQLNRLTDRIIGCAIRVHHELGPGLLESTYEKCLAFELMENGFKVEVQKEIPVVYRQVCLECGYRIDMPVNDFGRY